MSRGRALDPAQLAERALAAVPGGEAQVTVHAERSLFSRFARSSPTQATSVDRVTVEVAYVRGGQVGVASTTDVAENALRDVAQRAAQAADALARAGEGTYPGVAGPADVAAHAGYDAATAELDPAPAGAALRAAFEAAREHGLEAFGLWTAGETRVAVATTTGQLAVDRMTDAHMKVLCRARDGRSGFAAATGTSLRAIDARALAAKAAGKVVPGEAVALEPGTYPVVLEPDAVGQLLGFLGYLGFNGLAHAEGRGALVDRLGTAVAASCISIADVPDDPGTLPRAFDGEGVPKRALSLISEGVAQAVVHDRRSAALAGGGAASTGHARRAGGDPFGPMPTNLVLAGGNAASVDELLAPVERGIYVTRLWYVNPLQPKQTVLTGMTRDGTFLIEDGALGPRIRDVRFTDSVLRILEATEALTRASDLVSEAEFYGPRDATGQLCPALRAGEFRVTGVTIDEA